MVMGALLIAVMSYLFIDESRRGDALLFRPTSLIAAVLALLNTSGVMYHVLKSGFAVGMFFAMGGVMPNELDRMGISPLEYGLFFTMTSVGHILGNFINGLLVERVGVVQMTYVGSLLKVLVPILMLAGGLAGLLTPSLLSFLCFCFCVCNGPIIANAIICTMRAAGCDSGVGNGFLGEMQMLFSGVAGNAIIALGGADHFSVTATGLLIMALCAAL